MGQPLIMIPPSSTAPANIEESQVVSASALFNMMHNLGGYLDIVALATLLIHREQFHANRLGDSVSLYALQTWQWLEQSIATVNNLVRRES